MDSKPAFAALALILAAQLACHAAFSKALVFGDEGYYANEADFVSRGMVIYRDFFDNHSPGIAYAGAAGFAVFGRSFESGRLVVALVQAAATVAVFYFASRLYGNFAGTVAAGYYAAAEVLMGGFWFITEQFLAFFILLSAFCAWQYFSAREKPRGRDIFLAGFFAGVALLFKQPAACFAAALAAFAASDKASARGVPLLLAGIMLPVALASAYFLASGALPQAAYGVLLFNFGVKGMRDADFSLLFTPFSLLQMAPLLVGAAPLAWKAAKGGWSRLDAFLFAWIACAAMAAFPRFTTYHLMAALAPAAIIFSGAAEGALSADGREAGWRGAALRGAIAFFALDALAVAAVAALSGQMGDEISAYSQVESYVHAHCGLSEGVFGFPGGAYFFMNATPATYYLEFSPWLVSPEIEADTIAELEEKRPDCAVVWNRWLELSESRTATPRLYAYVEDNYGGAWPAPGGEFTVLKRNG
ncbi:MAG: glycosyltransferase family 39 protein [Candidatus ainarchaeum sp.]|nr:glycosyltransferase family 39 protein [Candidatus ainarchaeum sp.]